MGWIEFAIGWAVIAFITLWMRRVFRRIQRRYHLTWLTDDSGPHNVLGDSTPQSCQLISVVASRELSEVVVTLKKIHQRLDQIERALKVGEMTQSEAKNADDA